MAQLTCLGMRNETDGTVSGVKAGKQIGERDGASKKLGNRIGGCARLMRCQAGFFIALGSIQSSWALKGGAAIILCYLYE